MSDLVIGNKIIDSPIKDILLRLRKDCNNEYLSYIGNEHNNNIKITCPFHAEGKERHPSMFVYSDKTSSEVPYGFYRCFTCGESGSLWKLVGKCLNVTSEEGKQWLLNNFDTTFEEKTLDLPEINLSADNTSQYLDESILDDYAYFHPYMFKRKLTEEVIKRFKIGFDKESNCITFPIWDEHNHLIGITKRNVDTKQFFIPTGMSKCVYLLNYIKSLHITEVWVCESQINALTCWGWGYPAIALLGTGSKHQYEILKKSGIRIYHLCLDGDSAGEKGTVRFLNSFQNAPVLIDVVNIPQAKDVNDLSFDEFKNLSRVSLK